MNIKYNLKIRCKPLDIILVLVLFEPNIFYKINSINYLYFALMLIECLWLASKFNKLSINLTFTLLFLYRFLLLFPTVIYGGDLAKWAYYSINFFALYFLLDLYHKNNKLFVLIKSVQYIFSTYLIINFFSTILYPDGFIDKMYFLGYRTRITDYAFVLIALALIRYTIDKKKFPLFLSIFSSMINLISQWVATGLLGVFLLLIFSGLFEKIFKKLKGIRFRHLYFTAVGLTIGIVIFRIQNLFAWFIETVLHRSVTLTYRTYLWDACWQIINQKVLLGHGVDLNNGNFIWNDFTFTQAHNQVLQSLYESGIVGTIFLLMFMYSCGRRLVIGKKSNFIVAIAIFIYMILMIVEIYMYYAPSYLLLLLAKFMSKDNENPIQKI